MSLYFVTTKLNPPLYRPLGFVLSYFVPIPGQTRERCWTKSVSKASNQLGARTLVTNCWLQSSVLTIWYKTIQCQNRVSKNKVQTRTKSFRSWSIVSLSSLDKSFLSSEQILNIKKLILLKKIKLKIQKVQTRTNLVKCQQSIANQLPAKNGGKIQTWILALKSMI